MSNKKAVILPSNLIYSFTYEECGKVISLDDSLSEILTNLRFQNIYTSRILDKKYNTGDVVPLLEIESLSMFGIQDMKYISLSKSNKNGEYPKRFFRKGNTFHIVSSSEKNITMLKMAL